MPELRPFAESFNLALTGEHGADLPDACNALVRGELDAGKVVRIATFLAEIFVDEVGAGSGAVSKSLVSTLGFVCALMTETVVADASERAHRDSLTGLENRRAWDHALRGSLGTDAIEIAMLDLDGLKQINDRDGHAAGDAHLRKFAADLGRGLPDSIRAYRFGGDEFAVMKVRGGELERDLLALSGESGVAPFSYGVASAAEGKFSADQLMELADRRMYEMKRLRKESRGVNAGRGNGDKS